MSDPRAITLALYEAARARSIDHLKAEITSIETEPTIRLNAKDQDAVNVDAVVIAAGAWSKELAASVGDRIPLDTERGYNITFPGATRLLNRPVSFQGHGFVSSPLDIGLRIGGAVELGGLHLPPNHERTKAMYQKRDAFSVTFPRSKTAQSGWVFAHRSQTRYRSSAIRQNHVALFMPLVTVIMV